MRTRLAVTLILLLALLASGCSSLGLPGLAAPTATEVQPTAAMANVQPTSAPTDAPTATEAPTPTEAATPTEAPTPTTAPLPAASPTAVPASAQTVSTSDQSAQIKAVIEKANAEQQQAFAKGDPTLMKDTATASYYSEIAQINDQMSQAGIASIKLLKIEWGPISVNGSNATSSNGASATATTYETWRTVYSDGTTEDSRDRNVYSLVLQNGAWLISADDHPDAQSGSATPGQTTVPGNPSSPTSPSQPTSPTSPSLPTSLDQSHNWSGYAATGGKYTSVTGTWTVPSLNTSSSSSSTGSNRGVGATWVGIGGTSSRDLIQAGTQEMTDGQGRVSYSAWTELLPAASENVPLTISPGDSVTVTISEQSAGQWLIDIKNNTTGKDYSTTVRYNSSYSSAEWVVEAPSAGRSLLPLDNFGSIQFTDATATKDGKTVTLSGTNAQPISMVDGQGQVLASPSGITSDGKGVTVTRSDVPATTLPVGRTGRGRRGF